MFLGRDRELSILDELHHSTRPELFVLYGRRRVGKTELLQQFCARKRAVYFLAAQVREKDNLRAFRDALASGLDDALAANIEFADWTAALNVCAEISKQERLVVVLDEFPYLCESTRGLTSQLQRFWDTRGKHSNLVLVLCGSQVSFMEQEVLAERSPLFGRRTAQRRLEPLEPEAAMAFFPRWKVRERALAYSILGGMPAYLRRFDDARSPEENVLRECLRPEGFLFDEVQFLLRSELSQPATYNSILAAVARGETKVGDIALAVGVDTTHANKYLTTLRELQLVEREVPLTDPDPLRSRRGSYRVADRFLAFHARPSAPARGRGRRRGDRRRRSPLRPFRARCGEDRLGPRRRGDRRARRRALDGRARSGARHAAPDPRQAHRSSGLRTGREHRATAGGRTRARRRARLTRDHDARSSEANTRDSEIRASSIGGACRA